VGGCCGSDRETYQQHSAGQRRGALGQTDGQADETEGRSNKAAASLSRRLRGVSPAILTTPVCDMGSAYRCKAPSASQ
jgi:hypothetical protein